jgi:uncharacterized LabA/DUF88 family protein
MPLNASHLRTAVFIDGHHLHACATWHHCKIDFKRLHKLLEETSNLVAVYYYATVKPAGEYQTLTPLLDWLQYNSYRLVTKPIGEFVDEQGRRKPSTAVDTHIAVDALELGDRVEHIVLVTGSADLCRLVAALQRRSIRVTVISSTTPNPSILADSLRRDADFFVDFAEIAKIIHKSPDRTSAAGDVVGLAECLNLVES